MLTAQQIRSRFLEFFEKRAHHVAQSAPLIPQDDPSLLFTNAGMVQFKKYFLGSEAKPWPRATSCQKCLRVSGKHNDLENVGRTARHHTFFEMLGNFSFGDYFKRDAITWAWEFVTQELKLPKDKLWVTVYKDDDEAAAIWKEVAGLPDERIVRMDEKDNFWTMGETGPCGPCSEIYIDQGEDMACGPDCGIGKCDCDRFLEIWNLVFTQFDQSADGSRALLAAPNIDTGMGLERIAAVCQGKRSNFDCDLFQQIINYAADLAGVKYSESLPNTNEIDTALRVIADHSRAAAFLIAEGVLPSNENRGYVLRRLIRRALRFATLMGVKEPFMHKVAAKVTEVMGDAYPELPASAASIERAVLEEEKRFGATLENGLGLLEEELERLENEGGKEVSGDICFRLYDTYGFPLDIVVDVAEKRGFGVDAAGFEKHMATQRERARASQKQSGLLGKNAGELAETAKKLVDEGIASEFVGYDTLDAQSRLLALLDADGNRISELGEGGRGFLVAAKTPFYPASGGQVGDIGVIASVTGHASVSGAIRPDPKIIMLEIQVTAGELLAGQDVEAHVDANTRMDAARNHTCTHLLHAALRKILGAHVKQSGSLVDARHLRFDFSHFSALTQEELAQVERKVNAAIMADLPVTTCEMPREEAMVSGAMALFSEKYGETVRVLTIGQPGEEAESVELCGGTHLRNTGQAGMFLITSDSAVAAGMRRIEAVCGWNAYNAAINLRSENRSTAEALKTRPDQIVEKARQLQEELKKMRKTADKAGAASAADLLKEAREVGGITLLEARLDGASVKSLREIMDGLRGALDHNAVICLGGVDNGKPALLLYVSKDLHNRFTAPELIKLVVEPCGGSGGGRPDLAQAGGTNPQGIAAGFAALEKKLAE